MKRVRAFVISEKNAKIRILRDDWVWREYRMTWKNTTNLVHAVSWNDDGAGEAGTNLTDAEHRVHAWVRGADGLSENRDHRALYITRVNPENGDSTA